MKWDRSKKKKFPSIAIEMSDTNYNNSRSEKIVDEENSIPLFQVWPIKHNSNSLSPRRGDKEHSFMLQSGDSGIESVQVGVLDNFNLVLTLRIIFRVNFTAWLVFVILKYHV